MAYSIRIKKEVINHVHQGMTVLEVSQMYNLSRNTVENWLKYPDKYLNETRTGLKCKLRHRPDGFAEQNGRGAERADTLTL